MMKKIISLLSVFAMIATMFTTIATADENNYIGWEVVEHTSTKLKANVVINTNQTITYAECTLSLADAYSKGLRTVSAEKVTASSFTASLTGRGKVVAFTYSGSFTGKTVMGTVEFDLTGVQPFTLTAGTPKLLLKGEANVDVTSSFTDNYTGYTVAPKADEGFKPAVGGNMVNPATGETNKTYLTDVVEFNTNETAPTIKIQDDAGTTKTFDGNWYPTNLKGQGTIKVLVIVRYAGETEKTFSIVNE